MPEYHSPRFTLEVLLSEDDWAQHLRDLTLAGLTSEQPWTPPVWFYDAAGSALFDKITMLDEYYPTRAERAILVERAQTIAQLSQAATLVELGAGSADKTRILLRAFTDAGTLQQYAPIDCSRAALLDAGASVNGEFPSLPVSAVVADFNAHLEQFPRTGRRMIAFLGSTIGNFAPAERREFLAEVSNHCAPEDTLLLGTDLVKSVPRMVAAYNDEAGVTADFNLNALAVMNRQLGANFDIQLYRHSAIWNADASRIEMRLIADADQQVTFAGLGGLTIKIPRDGWIQTEVSTKFTGEQVCDELAHVGLSVVAQWTDPDNDFLLTLAQKPA